MLEKHEQQAMSVEILFRQERLCEGLGMRERQRQIIDELVALLESRGGSTRLAEAFLRKGELHTILQEFDDAEMSLERSLQLRREQGDTLGERASLRGLSFLRWLQARYEDALACAEAALAIDRRHNRLNAIVGDLQNLASVYTIMGKHQPARACLEEALTLSNPAKGGSGPPISCHVGIASGRAVFVWLSSCSPGGAGPGTRLPGADWRVVARKAESPPRRAVFHRRGERPSPQRTNDGVPGCIRACD